MIEVFKTNVSDPVHANRLLGLIHSSFNEYKANFDLKDCDKILRIECKTREVNTPLLICLLKDAGFHAEILPETVLPD